jgi:hypothetical protein
VKLASPLATLLSVILATTSISASACDLSCWLHPADSDCHIAGSYASLKSRTVESRPSVPEMKSHHCGRSIGTHAGGTHAGDVARTHFASSATGMHGAGSEGSRTFSSCAQEECRKPSASTSPPRRNSSQTDPSPAEEIGILNLFSFPVSSQQTRLERPPSGIPAPDRLTTSLRI